MSDQLGALEQQVLLAVLRLHPIGYGLSIRQEIETQTGRSHSIGAIYTTLERLKSKGYLTSRDGEATAARGGRKKLYFTLTAQGKSTLKASLEIVRAMIRGTALEGALA